MTRFETPACTPINYGQTVGGSLEASDARPNIRTDSRADCYTFSVVADERIVVSKTSDDFDTYLSLLDPSGQVITSDNECGDGVNSQIPAEGVLTIPSTGEYSIEATTFFSFETGTYSLTLQRVDALSLTVPAALDGGKSKPGQYVREPKGSPRKPVKKEIPQK